MRAFVTGATGLVGSHLTEQLVAQGHTVRALARTSSDTSFLRTLDVEIVKPSLSPYHSILLA
ncbi:MAG: NAD(P)H-binding protein [Anaerolineae bacterium]|nr:NAD(P)H-binding protein [Anaerolineae bacterium]